MDARSPRRGWPSGDGQREQRADDPDHEEPTRTERIVTSGLTFSARP
jgi:hypothetical protein